VISISRFGISKNLANKIFPIKNEDFFRVRADDVIVLYASMISEICFLDDELTEYRTDILTPSPQQTPKFSHSVNFYSFL